MDTSSMAMFAVLLIGTILAVGINGEQNPSRSRVRRGERTNEENGRLPKDIRPYHYNLELIPDIYRTSPPFSFSGSVQIYFTSDVDSKVVTINSNGLAIDNSSVMISLVPGQDGNPSNPTLSSWSVNPALEFLHVTTTDSLKRNVSYILEMNFTGIMTEYEYGLHYDFYNSSDGNIKYMATTQLETHGGRQTFPCFDEPDFKATFNVTIVRKPPAVSVANTPLIRTEVRGDGWVADVYKTTPKMSLYLVAFAVGDLQKLPAERINGYEVNIWARPEIAPQMKFALSIAPRIQAWLDHETGITYREAKSDHLVVPNNAGGMENWGMISYGEQWQAFNPGTSSAAGRLTVAFLQAHEMTHLWYGDLVTCKWWDDAWLNEGIATYYEYRATQVLGWEGSEVSQVDTQYFMVDDQRNSSNPVRRSIPTVWDSWNAFSDSAYFKGGAMVHQLEGILTTPTLKAGLTRYLLANQYKTVTTDDLWKALTAQAAIDGITNPDGSALDVKLRMDPWLNQMGFPLISVTRFEDGTARLVRSHFLRPPNQIVTTPSPYNCTWDVPITIVSADSSYEAWNAAPSAWIDIDVSEATVSGFPTNLTKWAIINARFSMYYRVLYDDDSHNAIIRQLIDNHTAIHVESRSQIIDDAFSVARAGYIAEWKAMETTRYLADEEKWGPWSAALRHLKYSNRLIRKQFWSGLQRSYILGLTVPVYERLGWNYSDTETPLQQFLRRDMISVGCSYGHAACLSEARSQYSLIVPNPSANVVDPNNLPTVLSIGVYEGTETDWQLVFDQYLARKTSQIPEERYAYLYGCTCTKSGKLLKRLLAELGSSVEPRDRDRLALYLSQSEYGAQILWNYLDVNWNDTAPGLDRMKQLTNIATAFSTSEELDNLLAFKSRHPPASDKETSSYMDLVLDVENNILWLESEGLGLKKWLEDHQPSQLGVPTLRPGTFAKRYRGMEPCMDHLQSGNHRSAVNNHY